MNKDFDDIRRNVEGMLRDVEPNDPATVSYAITHYLIGIPMDKIHKASIPEPRIREARAVGTVNRTDGWRVR